jgi:hypothetical protein
MTSNLNDFQIIKKLGKYYTKIPNDYPNIINGPNKF